jgi:hypothetical protein
MFEKKEVVLTRVPEEAVLERVGVSVADATEPANTKWTVGHPRGHPRANLYSSAAQSRVSITLATSRKNAEA